MCSHPRLPTSTRSRCHGWLLPCLLSGPLLAQSGAWAADTAAPGLGGRVFSFTTWQAELYAGGHPFAAKGGQIGCVARWDGQQWQPVGTPLSLQVGWLPFSTATVRAMTAFNGELVVAGTFDHAGTTAVDNIARWNGATWQPLGLGLRVVGGDADVRALVVHNNELYAAGTFDSAGGLPCPGIARWNGSAWSPCGSGLGGFLPGIAGSGRALRVVGSDLIVGGDFFTAGGVAANCIARWNGSSFAPLGAGFDGEVDALAEYGGQLVAAGAFSFSGSTPAWGPSAWNGTGWQLLGSGGPSPQVTSLQVVGNHLYAGGAFVAPGPGVTRWDGSAWSSVGGVAGVFSGSISTAVLALGEHGSELLVGGEFTRGGNPPQGATAIVSTNVIAFDGVTWRGMGTGRGVQGNVLGVLPYGASWLAHGAFESVGEVAAQGLARWDGDRWQRFAACDGSVEHAVEWNGDLIVSGTFTSIGGQPIQRMARFDGVSWTAFGPPITVALAVHQGQLYAAGTTELRRWNGTAWTTAATVAGIVDDLHLHTDGNLYFTTSTFSQHRVYRWDGAAATQIGAPNDFPHCLGSLGNDLLVGGRFTTVNGVATTHLARWNGTNWATYASGVTGYAVDSLAALGGDLYVGANGDPRGFLLRWNGTTWQAVPGNLDGLPGRLFADPTVGSVHAFAAGHAVGGLPIWNYGEWRTQPQWRNLLHGTPGAGGVPRLHGLGTLQAGSPWSFSVAAAPNHLGLLGLGLTRVDLPLFGGLLVPSPDLVLLLLGDPLGDSSWATAWPGNVPAGLQVFAQAWLLDGSGPAGWTATNALACLAP